MQMPSTVADSFDEANGEYVGLRLAQLVSIELNSDMVLVHRTVADAQLAKQGPQAPPLGWHRRHETDNRQPSTPGEPLTEPSSRAGGRAASTPRSPSTPIVRRRR